MNTSPLCPTCGKPLAPDAPKGLCQECLLKAGFPTGTELDPTGSKSPFVPPAPEELAAKFPQLEILELLGRGGMGAVYKARQKQLDRIVALKILPPGIGNHPAFAERFTREARALAKLNHPNIVTIHDFGRAEDLYFFVMEFVDGVTLRQLLNTSRISSREALAIVPQICDALQFAHDHGIVHRDVKPENILMDRRGRVKVADFGLAKIIENAQSNAESGQPITGSHDNATGVMGTPNYMAPEQIAAPSEVDHRADIYALGVVFYQMLTGELPGKHIEAPSKKVQIDVRLDEIVLRALEKNPEQRYEQASVLKTRLEDVASSAAPPPISPLPPAPARAPITGNVIDNARRLLKIPAIGLMISAIFSLLPLIALFYLVQQSRGGVKGTFAMILLPILPALGVFVMWSASRMLQVRSYGLCIAASILAMITPPGFVLGVPFGIWALVVLSRRDVRDAFHEKKKKSNNSGKSPDHRGRGSDSPSSTPSTQSMPKALWISIVLLTISTLGNFILLLNTGPLLLIDIVFKIGLIVGLRFRSKLAYVATIASALFGAPAYAKLDETAYVLLGFGMIIGVIGPIIWKTKWFFPSDLPRRRAWLAVTVMLAIASVLIGLAAPKRALVGRISKTTTKVDSRPSVTKASIASSPYKVTLTNGSTVEVIAVARNPLKYPTWWNPDGTIMAEPPGNHLVYTPAGSNHENTLTDNDYAIFVQYSCDSSQQEFAPNGEHLGWIQIQEGDWRRLTIENAQRWARILSGGAGGRKPDYQNIGSADLIRFPAGTKETTVNIAVAAAPWTKVAVFDGKRTKVSVDGIQVLCTRVPFDARDPHGKVLTITHDIDRDQYALRVIAVLKNGKKEKAALYGSGTTARETQSYVQLQGFEQNVDNVKEFILERTPWVRTQIPHIALSPGATTKTTQPPQPTQKLLSDHDPGAASNPLYVWCGNGTKPPYQTALPHGGTLVLHAITDKTNWWKPNGEPLTANKEWQEMAERWPDHPLVGIVEAVHPNAKPPKAEIGPAGEEYVIPHIVALGASIPDGVHPQLIAGFGTGPWEGESQTLATLAELPISLTHNKMVCYIESAETIRPTQGTGASKWRGQTEFRYWLMGPREIEASLVVVGKDGRETTVSHTWGITDSAGDPRRRWDLVGWADMDVSEIDQVALRTRTRAWGVFVGFATNVVTDQKIRSSNSQLNGQSKATQLTGLALAPELTLKSPTEDRNLAFFDFDRDRFVRPSADLDFKRPIGAIYTNLWQWALTNGVDIEADTSEEIRGLKWFGTSIVAVPDSEWENATAQSITFAVRKHESDLAFSHIKIPMRGSDMTQSVASANAVTTDTNQTRTFAFRTRENRAGLIRLIQVTDEPHGFVKIHYKMVASRFTEEEQRALSTEISQIYRKFVALDAATRGTNIPNEYWGSTLQKLKPIRVIDDRANIKVVLSEDETTESGLYVNQLISSYAPSPQDFLEFTLLSASDRLSFGNLYHYTSAKKTK